MFKWFRTSALEPLSVSMAGAKLGDRVLIIGCGDPPLVAALAAKTGLTGRTCAVDESSDRATEAGRVALKEGALAETSQANLGALEFENASFDLVVLRDVLGRPGQQSPAAVVAEAARVLRPGGRCLVIDTARRSGLAAIFAGQASSAPQTDALEILLGQGFVAARVLAERDGLRFVEAIKPAGTLNRDTQG